MPTIILMGDFDTGHENHGTTPVITGSPTVKVEGKAVARQGDALASHGDNDSYFILFIAITIDNKKN